MKRSGVPPNVISYSACIGASARVGDVALAENFLNQMLAAGLLPNVVSYSSVISACAKVGNVRRAEYWLRTMRAAGVAPNTITYSNLIQCCSRARNCDLAEHYLKTMAAENVTPNVVSPVKLLAERFFRLNALHCAQLWSGFSFLLRAPAGGSLTGTRSSSRRARRKATWPAPSARCA